MRQLPTTAIPIQFSCPKIPMRACILRSNSSFPSEIATDSRLQIAPEKGPCDRSCAKKHPQIKRNPLHRAVGQNPPFAIRELCCDHAAQFSLETPNTTPPQGGPPLWKYDHTWLPHLRTRFPILGVGPLKKYWPELRPVWSPSDFWALFRHLGAYPACLARSRRSE